MENKMKVSSVVREPSILDNNKYQSLINILKGHEEFILDSNGVIISSNLEAVNITGFEEHEVIGKGIDLFYTDDEKLKAVSDLKKAARMKQITVAGIRQKKRGISFWAKMKIQALQDLRGELKGYKVTLQDATHRALSQARVQSIKDEYLTIFNNPFVGTFKFRTSDRRVTMWNLKASQIVGIEAHENLIFSEIFSSQNQFDEFLNLIINTRKVESFKFQIKNRKEHKDQWGIINARYFDANEFVEGIFMDVSEQHQQMLELQRLNTELDNFTYHASHDLRSPLTSMMGLVNLGMKESSTPVIYTYLDMIQERIKHLDVLLKDLISVTYNNKTELEYKRFEFKAEIDTILKDHVCQDIDFDLNVEVQQGEPFYTDSIRMRTILRNLISNAFKYRNPDANRPFIRIKVRIEHTHAALQLQDNGIGIEWIYKDRIWDMFFRATTRSTGTGLGLYIVKSMIEKLNGYISFESTLSTGTTFLLVVPNTAHKVIFNRVVREKEEVSL